MNTLTPGVSTIKTSKTELVLLGIVILTFGTIYSLITFVNHYEFRTYALDLGMFNNALYCFAHLKANHFPLDVMGRDMNYFGDHFSPITILYSPFYYIFGSYTLLIVQVLSIVLGGIGIFKYCKTKFPVGFIPLIITIQFFCFWGIYSALSFDFHNNVVAAMMVPFLFFYYETGNKRAFLVTFFLILICKENMPLWLIFILLGLMLKYGIRANFFRYLRFEIPLCILASVYFIIVTTYIMPHLQNSDSNVQLHRYVNLGNTPIEILKNLYHDPQRFFTLIFENPPSMANYYGIKSETHFMLLMSGGIMLFFRPYYLVMLIPIYAQKFFSSEFGIWGINGQYSIEFAPIVSLAIADSLVRMHNPITKYIVAIFLAYLTYHMNRASLENRVSLWYLPDNSRYYDDAHYQSNLSLPEVYKALELVPDKVPICVSSRFAPHLANREKIYAFPIINDAQYLVLCMNDEVPWPLTKEEFKAKVDELRNSGQYTVVYDNYNVLILQKKDTAPSQ